MPTHMSYNRIEDAYKFGRQVYKDLERGYVVTIAQIGTFWLGEAADKKKRIHFVPSSFLGGLETPPTQLVVKRVKCLCRLTGGDVPPGLDPYNVVLKCRDDPKCPNRKEKK